MKKIIIFAITVTFIVSMLFIGTLAVAAAGLELTITHQWPKSDIAKNYVGAVWNEMLDAYVAAHPNVKFNILVITQPALDLKLQAQAAANDLPDVFMLKGSWVSNFVKNDLLLDLAPYLEKFSSKDSYKPVTLKAYTRDGKIYGLPTQVALTSFVYYNADLWKSIGYDTFPTNWDEIKAAAEKFKEKGIIPFAAGNKDKWYFESCWLSTLGDRFTGTEWTQNIIENNGKAKFTDPNFVASLKFLQDLASSGLFNADFNSITSGQSMSLYAQGKAATMVNGYWAISSILNQASPETLKTTKMTILPPVPNQKGDPNTVSASGSWAIAVNNHLEGAKRDLAADFCLSLTGVDFSTKFAEEYGGVGACNVKKVDVTKFDQLTQDYVALAASGIGFTPVYDIEMDGAVIQTMNTSLQELLNGVKSAQQVAEEIQAEQDRLEK